MKKSIFLIIMILIIVGCTSIEKYEEPNGEILKKEMFSGAVKVVFTGRAERAFLSGDIIKLEKEYYLLPGEYLISWEPRSYISIGVSVGNSGRGNNNTHNKRDQRSSEKVSIEKNSIIELKGNSVISIDLGGEL